MFLVIAYDISDDRRRARVHGTLRDYGTAVQKSVFECRISDAEWRKLRERLEGLLVPEDSWRAYRLCEACVVRAVGAPEPEPPPSIEV